MAEAGEVRTADTTAAAEVAAVVEVAAAHWLDDAPFATCWDDLVTDCLAQWAHLDRLAQPAQPAQLDRPAQLGRY